MTKELDGKKSAPVLNNDPRFFRLKTKSHKFKVDSRFKSMFKEDSTTRKTKIDKYGRRTEHESEVKDLKRFYRLSSDEELSEESDSSQEATEDSGAELDDSDIHSQEPEDSEEYLMDKVMSSHPLVNKNIEIGEASRRLAIVNLDWDQINAKDIYMMLSGFKPLSGLIESVKIFPSEFGKERLQKEQVSGPQIVKFTDGDLSETDDEGPTHRTILEQNKRLLA